MECDPRGKKHMYIYIYIYISSFHPISIDSSYFITGIKQMLIHSQLFEVRFTEICFGRTRAFVLAGRKKNWCKHDSGLAKGQQ